MRLNGWQRLWVVLSLGWTVLVGGIAVKLWPEPPPLLVEYQLPFHADAVTYDEALSRVSDKGPGLIYDYPGPIVDVPNFGKVQFPAGLSKEVMEIAQRTLKRANAKYIKGVNAASLLEFQAKRMKAAETAALFWLLPPIVLYLFGWSVRWVYRGFINQ